MKTPDFTGVSTRTLEAELLKIDAAIQSVETAKATIRQISQTAHLANVENALDYLHGLLDDAMDESIDLWRVNVNDEIERRDAAIDARHERIELQNKMGC